MPSSRLCLGKPFRFRAELSAPGLRFILAGLLVGGASAFAQTSLVWSSTSDSTFSNGANWTGGAAPANNTTANLAKFATSGLANPVLTASQSVAGVSFTTGGYTLSSSNGSVLTLGSSGLFNHSGTNTVSAALGGSGGVTVGGGSTLTLSGTDTYTGSTAVSGTLVVNGSLSANSTLTVYSGGTLAGTGTINGPASIAGNLGAGTGTGELTFNNSLTLGSAANSIFAITSTSYDTVSVAGSLTYNGSLTLDFATTPPRAGEYELFNSAGASQSFVSVTATGSVSGSLTDNGGNWTLDSNGTDLQFNQATGSLLVTESAVPEPVTSSTMAGLSALAVALWRRRRRKPGAGESGCKPAASA